MVMYILSIADILINFVSDVFYKLIWVIGGRLTHGDPHFQYGSLSCMVGIVRE
jgi:hypothetical protein